MKQKEGCLHENNRFNLENNRLRTVLSGLNWDELEERLCIASTEFHHENVLDPTKVSFQWCIGRWVMTLLTTVGISFSSTLSPVQIGALTMNVHLIIHCKMLPCLSVGKIISLWYAYERVSVCLFFQLCHCLYTTTCWVKMWVEFPSVTEQMLCVCFTLACSGRSIHMGWNPIYPKYVQDRLMFKLKT